MIQFSERVSADLGGSRRFWSRRVSADLGGSRRVSATVSADLGGSRRISAGLGGSRRVSADLGVQVLVLSEIRIYSKICFWIFEYILFLRKVISLKLMISLSFSWTLKRKWAFFLFLKPQKSRKRIFWPKIPTKRIFWPKIPTKRIFWPKIPKKRDTAVFVVCARDVWHSLSALAPVKRGMSDPSWKTCRVQNDSSGWVAGPLSYRNF